jgi:SPW repeat-containing protein
MRRGFIPVNTHAAVEPLAAAILVASAWIFGFSHVGSAKGVAIAVGIVMLLSGSTTRWRFSVLKVIPLRVHFMTDVALGMLLVLSPFIFGFSHNGAATRFMIIAGVLELLTALSTRWDPAPTAQAHEYRSDARRTAH